MLERFEVIFLLGGHQGVQSQLLLTVELPVEISNVRSQFLQTLISDPALNLPFTLIANAANSYLIFISIPASFDLSSFHV